MNEKAHETIERKATSPLIRAGFHVRSHPAL